MKILVTGAAGYIGSHVCKILHERGHNVTAIDKSRDHNKIDKYCTEIMNYDIMNLSRLGKFDVVVHLAGYISVEESTKYPSMYYNNNLNGTFKILSDYPDAHIIFASTAGAFDPQSPYARSKVAAEDVIKEQAKDYTIFRFFNVAGSDGVNMQVGEATHLIRIAAEVAAGKRDEMYVFGSDYETRDGTCIRDYIHVVDLASAICNSAERGPSNTPYECIGSGQGYTVMEVLRAMHKVTGALLGFRTVGRRAGDPPILAIDSQYKHLEIKHTLEDMCRSAYEAELRRGN